MSLILISLLWGLSTVAALWSWSRVLRHSRRAARSLDAEEVNGVYASLARTSVRVDLIGIAQGACMAVLLLSAFVFPLFVPDEWRAHLARLTLAALGAGVALMGHLKLRGEAISRRLISRQIELERQVSEGGTA